MWLDDVVPSPETVIEVIRRWNDIARMGLLNPMTSMLTNSRVMFSGGIASLPRHKQGQVLQAVAGFKDFNDRNDPHGEHDCASFWLDGIQVVFKFDYYAALPDGEMDEKHGSEAPEDLTKTVRVLTVMTGSEY